MFSQYAAKKDIENLKALAVKSMSALFAVMTPITVVCIYYNKEIVKIVYERGAFTDEQTVLTSYIFIFVSLSLFFLGGNGVLNNAFYGMQDTKTPRLGAVIAVGSNIILNLILVRYMQAAGLALATSISMMLNYAILLIFFRRKCGAFGGLSFVCNIAKCTIAIAGMIPIFLLCEYFRNTLPTFAFFAVCVMLGLIVYALLLYVMKVDIFIFGLQKVKDIFKKDKSAI
jgi:putative peptidoglycan lipid II flippase